MSLSPFELLASSVFEEICTYLSLDEKCRCFPMLSQSINQSFIPKTCCRQFVSLDLTENLHQLLHCVENGRLAYLQYATRLSINLCYQFELTVDDDVIDRLSFGSINALQSNHLKSLFLREEFHTVPMLSPLLINHFNQSINLEELWLYFDSFEPVSFDWTIMSKINQSINLKLLYFTFSGFTPDLDALMRSLPQSINQLMIDAQNCPDEDLLLIFRKYLKKDTFLPYLQEFRLSINQSLDCDREMIDCFTSTVMIETQTIRPILRCRTRSGQPRLIDLYTLQELEIDRYDQKAETCLAFHQSISQSNKQSINQSINQVTKQSRNESLKQPITQSNKQSINQKSINQSVNQSFGPFHRLRRLKVSIYLDSIHYETFLRLLSINQLIDLHLSFRRHSRTMIAETIACLSINQSIKYLHFDFIGGGETRLSSLLIDLPVNNWLMLEVLHIYTSFLSPSFLRILLCASPNCKQVELIDCAQNQSINQSLNQTINQSINQSINSVKAVFMILFYCKSIVRIDALINQSVNQSINQTINQSINQSFGIIQHIDTIQSIINQFPLTKDHMQNLRLIDLPMYNFCDASLHLLIDWLIDAPKLRLVDFRLKNPSMLAIYMINQLPHLLIPYLPINQSINQSISPTNNQSNNQSVNQPINQSINQSISQSEMDELIDLCFHTVKSPLPSFSDPLERLRSLNQSISQSISQSIKPTMDDELIDEYINRFYPNQSVNQSNNPDQHNQSINQSINRTCLIFKEDGQNRLIDFLYTKLSQKEKHLLKKWNSGNCTNCCHDSLIDSCCVCF